MGAAKNFSAEKSLAYIPIVTQKELGRKELSQIKTEAK
jgi:hypothetical protein